MIFFVLLAIQLLIFGGLIILIQYMLKKHMGTASSHLDALTKDTTAKLADAKKKMEDANSYYRDILTKSRDEGEAQKQSLIDEGIKQKQELIDQARKQTEEMVERAHVAAENIKQEMDKKVHETAAKKTAAALRRLMPGMLNEEFHDKWVNDLLNNGLGSLKRLRADDHGKEILLRSAYALKTNEKKLISERLKQALGHSVTLKEETDPSLILGIHMKIGNVVLDGSLLHRIQEVLKNEQSADR